jgi:hypothetical protein
MLQKSQTWDEGRKCSLRLPGRNIEQAITGMLLHQLQAARVEQGRSSGKESVGLARVCLQLLSRVTGAAMYTGYLSEAAQEVLPLNK